MAYVSVDVEVDVDAGEYLSSCSPKEIKELIKYLKEDGHLANIIDTKDELVLILRRGYTRSEYILKIEEILKIGKIYNGGIVFNEA